MRSLLDCPNSPCLPGTSECCEAERRAPRLVLREASGAALDGRVGAGVPVRVRVRLEVGEEHLLERLAEDLEQLAQLNVRELEHVACAVRRRRSAEAE